MANTPASRTLSLEQIQATIRVIRDQPVMLDEDLAPLYGVETKRLVQQVTRNKARFPEDFMFQLSKDEFEALRSQNATSKQGRGGRRTSPYAFTEQGVAMLSSVLRSKQAVAVNIEIMRAFVEMRRAARDHAEISKRLDELEEHIEDRFGAQDEAIRAIVAAINGLIAQPPGPKGKLGFAAADDG